MRYEAVPMEELLARVRVALRHKTAGATTQLAAGPIRVDIERHRAFIEDVPIYLTPTEFDLLRFLVEQQGRMLTQRLILQSVWGDGYAGENHVLRRFLHQLRQKLNAAVPGKGELVEDDPELDTASGTLTRFRDDGGALGALGAGAGIRSRLGEGVLSNVVHRWRPERPEPYDGSAVVRELAGRRLLLEKQAVANPRYLRLSCGWFWGDAGVAQLAEHLLPKQGVAGSNPVSRSTARIPDNARRSASDLCPQDSHLP